MKQAIRILLVAALMLSMSACSAKMSKEELLESAEPLDLQTAMDERDSNENRARDMYLNNVYEVSGYISSISSDHCFIESGNKMRGFFYVYLSDEDMLKISKGDFITVVGKITSVNVHNITMKNAYLVEE